MDDTSEGESTVLEDTLDTREGEPRVLEDTLVESAPHVLIIHDTSSEPLINPNSDSEYHHPPAEERETRHN